MALFNIHTHQETSRSASERIVSYSAHELLAKTSIRFEESCFYSVGLHPQNIDIQTINEQLDFIEDITKQKQIIAIGEAGLDKLAQTSIDVQISVFEKIVNIANRHHLPLIIHCVKCIDELIAIKKRDSTEVPWIWHGFRGKKEQMTQLVNNGFYLSFGQYYNENALKATPIERLFLETDTADLNIEILIQKAACIKSISPETLKLALQENAQKVFFKK